MSELPLHLPPHPSLEQLRKLAKQRLLSLRTEYPDAKLAQAQHWLAREYGFDSWPKLVSHIRQLSASSQQVRITAPVSRSLGAREIGATVAFWRDVLGFSVVESSPDSAGATLVCGEARVRFEQEDWSPDFSGGPHPPGSAIVFFQVGDVAAMHAAVVARGGAASSLEKVNWLKLRMFEVRDPDGHTLWFGESYQRDMRARSPRMMTKTIPELPFDHVPAAVRHYRQVLGFSIDHEQHDLGVMYRDHATILLISRTAAHTGIGSAFFYVLDVDDLYQELLQAGADVQAEPVSQPWGIREFVVLDLEGNRLTLGQTFE